MTDSEPDDGQDVAGGIAKVAKKLEVSEALPLIKVDRIGTGALLP